MHFVGLAIISQAAFEYIDLSIYKLLPISNQIQKWLETNVIFKFTKFINKYIHVFYITFVQTKVRNKLTPISNNA